MANHLLLKTRLVAVLLGLVASENSFGVDSFTLPSLDTIVCEQQTNAIPNRPTLDVTEVITVTDIDGNGAINQVDVNGAIVVASSRRRRGQLVGVDLSAQSAIVVTAPIVIKSGVLLFSNTLTKISQSTSSFTPSDSNSSFLIDFETGARGAGLAGIHTRTGFSPLDSIVNISADVQGVRIYNNLFVDEYDLVDRDDNGNLDGTPAIDIGNLTKDIVIDSNSFQHVVFAVKGVRARITDVTISRNTVSRWRAKAIWFAGIFRNGVEYSPSGVSILQNTIAPPNPGGGIRQPINISTLDTTASARNSIIRFNRVVGPGLAHVAATDQTATRSTSGGTADMISVHNANDFLIDSNCVSKGGEVGINASRGARNGIISNNLVSETDLIGVNVGIGDSAAAKPSNIAVSGNIITNAGRDRADEYTSPTQRHIHSGIHVENASAVTVSTNRIVDNDERLGNPQKLFYGIFVRNAARVTVENDNRFAVSSGVIQIENLGNGAGQ